MLFICVPKYSVRHYINGLSRGFEAPPKEERLFPIYRWKWHLPRVAHSSGGWAGNVPKCAWFSLPRATTLCFSVSTNSANPHSSFYPRLSPLPLDSSHKRCQQLTSISHASKCLIIGRKFLPQIFPDFPEIWKCESSMEEPQNKKPSLFLPQPSWQLYHPLWPGRYLG